MADQKRLVEMLVEAGMDKKVATDNVKKLVARVDELHPKESQEFKDTLINIKLKELVRGASAVKYRGTLVALDDKRDSLGYMKYKALERYKSDPHGAIADHMVRVEGDKVIPLDVREYFDEERQKPNKNYGKPLPTVMRREAYFIIDGKLVRAFGDFEGKIGGVYDVYGTINENGVLNVSKTPEMKLVETVKDQKLYEAVEAAAGETDMGASLVDVEAADKGTSIITRGYIDLVQITSNGGTMVVLSDDEAVDGVTGFAATEDIGATLQGFSKGSEIVVIGRVMQSGDRPKGIVITGAVLNPGSAKVSKALKGLDDFEW